LESEEEKRTGVAREIEREREMVEVVRRQPKTPAAAEDAGEAHENSSASIESQEHRSVPSYREDSLVSLFIFIA